MADWIETRTDGYNVYAYDGNDWISAKAYAYWEGEPVQDEWYVYDGTKIIGLTAKQTTQGDPTSIVYDAAYGWGQASYIIPSDVTDIDRHGWINYYDKGGTPISGLPVAPPSQSCSIYFHDNMTFTRASGQSLFSGYPPINKIRFPNNFTGLNNDNVFALFGDNPSNVPLSTLEEITLPPSFAEVTSVNFGNTSFSKSFFPDLHRIKIMRSGSTSAINFMYQSFQGTAIWNSDLGQIGTAAAINPAAEIYFDFDESEISSKINFNTAASDTDLTTFKGVFYWLKNQGRVYFNQAITNN